MGSACYKRPDSQEINRLTTAKTMWKRKTKTNQGA